MSHEDRKQPLPIAAIIAVVALVLLIGLWFGRRQVVDRPIVPVEIVDSNRGPDAVARLKAGMAGRRDQSTESRQIRGDFAPIDVPAPEEVITDGAATVFPATEDHQTSHALELAMKLPPGVLTGWVSDTESQPIIDAVVSLAFESDAPPGEKVKIPKLSAKSDENGVFRLAKVPPGQWTLSAERENFAKGTVVGVVVHSGDGNSPVSVQLGPQVGLKGTVTATGKPADRAKVTAWREVVTVLDQGSVKALRVVYEELETDDKGAFEFKELPTGSLRILAELSGYSSTEVSINSKKTNKDIKIDLAAGSIIGGVVRGMRQQPIEGAELTLFPAGAPVPKEEPLKKTKSQTGGTFALQDLPTGASYRLHATAEGYAAAGPIEVQSGTTTNIVQLVLGGAIEGAVTDSMTGEPANGVGVLAVRDNDPRNVARRTKTMTDGKYRLESLPSGTWTVTVLSETYVCEPKTGVAVAAALVKGIDLSIYPGIDLIGAVVDGETGERLPGATVSVDSKTGPKLLTAKQTTTVAEDGGGFRLDNMPQGVFILRASMKGYTVGSGDESERRVEALIGVTPEPVDLKLFRGGVIDGIVTARGRGPVPGAIVQIYHAPGSPGRIDTGKLKTTTDHGGRFRIEGISLDQELSLYASAWAGGFAKGKSTMILLSRNQPDRIAEISLDGGVPVRVSVEKSGEGGGIADAQVSLSHPDFPGDPAPPAWSEKTGPDGTVVFVGIPPGKIRLNASKEGWLAGTVSADVVKSESAEVSIVLEEAFSIAGKVMDARGEAIRAGKVGARPEGSSKGGGEGPIKEDSSFRIGSVGPGMFRLEATAIRPTPQGQRQVTWEFPAVPPNQGAGELFLRIPMNGVIEGEVIFDGADGKTPAFSVALSGKYTDTAGKKRTITTSAAFKDTSHFRFESLPPGEYIATANSDQYLPAKSEIVDVPSPGVAYAGQLYLTIGGKLRFRAVNLATKEAIPGLVGKLVPGGPSAKTDVSGVAMFNTVVPGIYTLELTHADYLPKSVELVRVTRNNLTEIDPIEVDSGAILFGKVLDGVGDPAKSILVEARAALGTDFRRVTTDGGGRYSLRGLIPGGQMVSYSGKLHERSVASSLDLLVSATRPTEQDVALWANSKLIVQLAGPSTVQISRALVVAYPLRGTREPMTNSPIAMTNDFGSRFSVENLIEGYYLISVTAPTADGKKANWAGVTSVVGRENQIVVKAGSITLKGLFLRSDEKTPVKKQELTLELLSAPQSGVAAFRDSWKWTVKADNEGRFAIGHLTPGTYSLVAHNDGLKSDILEVLTLSGDGTVYEQSFIFK